MADTPQSGAMILMVDDRMENLVALEAILQPLGHGLVRATSGQEALRQVLLHDFAVILLDVQMPGMNGFETAQLIKSRERSRATPIIFLTAISKEEEYVFEGYSAGAVDYMFKPFNPEILRSKVAVFVELYLKTVQLRQQDEMLREGERREMELMHRAQLLESEARYADIVDSALEAIVTFGGDRRITLFNAAAERVFGCSAAAAVGTAIDRFFRPALDLSPAPSPRGRGNGTSPRAGESSVREAVGVRGDGECFPAEFSLSSLMQRNERMYTLILRDISERRRAEDTLRAQAVSLANTTEELRVLNEELNRRTIELERAMGARSRFYANMSHELRTPINAILGYGQLLREGVYGELGEKQAGAADRLVNSGRHLLELVNDVLDISKLEAGKLEVHPEPTDLAGLLREVATTLELQARDKGLELRVEAPPEFPLVTDPARVRQIVLNLLSNAVKFTDAGEVRVELQPAGGRVEVRVADTGPGIAPEDQQRIFDEFEQTAAAASRGGTGLGLAISKRLAALLGGTLSLASRAGQGATFTLRLPLAGDREEP